MSKLLVATRNKDKIIEFKRFLRPYDVVVVSPDELNIEGEPPEDGETFAENSLLKANFYWQRSQLPTLADDTGLEVDALGGRPGVHSKRDGRRILSDSEQRQRVLKELEEVPEDKRTARITTVVTLRVAVDRNFQAQASVEGLVRDSHLPSPTGLPYRPILWLPQLKKYYAEVTDDEHEQINARKKAIEQLEPYLRQFL